MMPLGCQMRKALSLGWQQLQSLMGGSVAGGQKLTEVWLMEPKVSEMGVG